MSVEGLLDRDRASFAVEQAFEWRKWADEIPYIQFPQEWQVKVIPPFGRAVARFLVRPPGMMGPKDRVSVYLDCYEMLGCWDGPYWEVYPYRGDVGRCDMADVPRLLEMIADRSEPESEFAP